MADITKINLNGTDLTIVDSAATSAIAGEIARAQGAESAITSALSAEVVARESADTQIQTALSGKADTATTLSGYGIADAYTKSEVDTALSGKADTATTLSGYGITDAYTKTEVDTALSGKSDTATTYTKTEVDTALAGKANTASTYTKTEVDNAITAATSGLQATLTPGTGIAISSANVISCTIDTTLYVVVSSLPAEPAPGNENKIHLVPDPDGETGNEYIEYLWKGDEWEELGKTQVETDLSDYWTSAETQSAITEAIAEIDIPDPTKLLPVNDLPSSAETGAVVALNATGISLPVGFSYVESTTLGSENDRTGITLTVEFSAASGYTENDPLYLFTINGTEIYAYQNETHSEGVTLGIIAPGDTEIQQLVAMYIDSEDSGTIIGFTYEAFYHLTYGASANMLIDFYNLSGETAPTFVFPTTSQIGLYQKSETNWVEVTEGVESKIDAHITNTNNPHSVTAAQLGISASYSAATETLVLNIPAVSGGNSDIEYQPTPED